MLMTNGCWSSVPFGMCTCNAACMTEALGCAGTCLSAGFATHHAKGIALPRRGFPNRVLSGGMASPYPRTIGRQVITKLGATCPAARAGVRTMQDPQHMKGYLPYPPIMENQMEKKMENEREIGIILGIIGVIV